MRRQKPSEIPTFFAFDWSYIKLIVILPRQMLFPNSDGQFCTLLMNYKGENLKFGSKI